MRANNLTSPRFSKRSGPLRAALSPGTTADPWPFSLAFRRLPALPYRERRGSLKPITVKRAVRLPDHRTFEPTALVRALSAQLESMSAAIEGGR